MSRWAETREGAQPRVAGLRRTGSWRRSNTWTPATVRDRRSAPIPVAAARAPDASASGPQTAVASVETLPGLDREVPQLFQPVQELGLVVPELPHQRRSLVLEQIAALSDEDRPPPAVEQLTSGGDKGFHGTLPDA